MSAGTSAFLCLMVCLLVCSSEVSSIDQENITAELGQDVTLPFKALGNSEIKGVHWIRLDLDPVYVLNYFNGYIYPNYHHPSYMNRTDLKDREMKDGDVSMILKNVTMEDEATYECRTFYKDTVGLNIDLKGIINLKVLPPGYKDGGDKDGGAKDGGAKDGGAKDGGASFRGAKDGGAKDGGAEVRGAKAGILLGVVGLMLLLVF